MPKGRAGRRCAAIWRSGKLAGRNCGYWAEPHRLYCKRHGTQEGKKLSEEHKAAIARGRQEYWRRIHELAKTDPEAAAQVRGIPLKGSDAAKKRTRAATAGAMAKRRGEGGRAGPNEEDKRIKQARIALDKAQEQLPALPDKPFEEMEPHEQMVVNLGLSLQNLHQILRMPMGRVIEEEGKKVFVADVKMISIIKDTSLRTIASVIKIDTNRMRAAKADKTLELLNRLREEVAARKESPAGQGPTLEGKAEKVA